MTEAPKFNVTYNPRYVCDLRKKMNLSFQKSKFVSDSMDDPEHIKERRRWKCVTWPGIRKQAKHLNGVILFGDEVSFAQWGSLAKTWAPRGVQPILKTAGKRKGMKIFGAIEKLWKQTKKDATQLKYFPTFDDLRNSVLKTFKKYLNDAMQILCVMRSLRNKAGLE